MHLAQIMIKGTSWESAIFEKPPIPSDERMLKKFRADCAKVESEQIKKSDQEFAERKKRSQAFVDAKINEKKLRDKK